MSGYSSSNTFRFPLVAGVVLLTLRGVFLWMVVPIGVLEWLIAWHRWRRRGVSLGAILGWADLNLVAALERTLLRPLVLQPIGWTSWRELPHVEHRIRATDPA